jgi:hypothetical protein
VTDHLCHRLDAPPASRGQHCATTEQGRTPAPRFCSHTSSVLTAVFCAAQGQTTEDAKKFFCQVWAEAHADPKANFRMY